MLPIYDAFFECATSFSLVEELTSIKLIQFTRDNTQSNLLIITRSSVGDMGIQFPTIQYLISIYKYLSGLSEVWWLVSHYLYSLILLHSEKVNTKTSDQINNLM